MRANEFLNEDDYYPSDPVDNTDHPEEEIQAFVDQFVEDIGGEPYRGSAMKHSGLGGVKIIVGFRAEPASRHRRKRSEDQIAASKQADKVANHELGEDLIERLQSAGFGRYEISVTTPTYVELEKTNLNESTCAGGMATVVGALGAPAFTRNASIYGGDKKSSKKKKKSAKYANSVNESSGDNSNVVIDTPTVKFEISYDARPGIRSWFLVGYMKYGSRDSYVYTKDDKFKREIPIELVGFHEYKPFTTSNDALMALRATSFYKMSNQDK